MTPARPTLQSLLLLASLQVLGSGCSPAVVAKSLPSAVTSRQEERLDPALLQSISGERDGDPYRVGAGDVLVLAVYGHPELAMSQYTSTVVSGDNRRAGGLVVDNDGTIQFPLIGSVRVAGKTSEELRRYLEQELLRYIKEPRVTVQVAFAGSNRYYLLGQFTQPGLKFADRPMNLLEALALGGSITLEKASLRGAYVARGGKRIPVNFRKLLRDGDMSQNIRLRANDVVFVPDNLSDQAFVYAATGNGSNRGGPVPFSNGRLDLLQALAAAGFSSRDRFQSRMSRVHVLRSEGDRGEYFVVDASRILNGDAAPFQLEPGDVVLVPPTGLTSLNHVLEAFLPTLQAVGGVISPYYQLRWLQWQTSR
ncbi:MAG: hypothetical protein RL385_1494 [Pseudomonadota bacterium]